MVRPRIPALSDATKATMSASAGVALENAANLAKAQDALATSGFEREDVTLGELLRHEIAYTLGQMQRVDAVPFLERLLADRAEGPFSPFAPVALQGWSGCGPRRAAYFI